MNSENKLKNLFECAKLSYLHQSHKIKKEEPANSIFISKQQRNLINYDIIFPPDIVINFLRYSDFITLTNCSRVCKSWNTILSSPIIWKDIYIRNFGNQELENQTLWKIIYLTNAIQEYMIDSLEEKVLWAASKNHFRLLKKLLVENSNYESLDLLLRRSVGVAIAYEQLDALKTLLIDFHVDIKQPCTFKENLTLNIVVPFDVEYSALEFATKCKKKKVIQLFEDFAFINKSTKGNQIIESQTQIDELKDEAQGILQISDFVNFIVQGHYFYSELDLFENEEHYKLSKNGDLISASIEGIILALIELEDNQQVSNISVFLLCYHQVITCSDLLLRLIQAYDVPDTYWEKEFIIKNGVIRILMQWINEGDFKTKSSPSDRKILQKFIETIDSEKASLIINALNLPSPKLREVTPISINIPIPKCLFSPYFCNWLLEIPPSILAQQLSVFFSSIIRNINHSEFAQLRMISRMKARAPNIARQICYHNCIITFFEVMILMAPSDKIHVCLEQIIGMIEETWKNSDFTSTMVLISVTISSAVFRLRKPWEKLSPKLLNSLKTIQGYTSSAGGYHLLREAHNKALKGDLAIPYSGMFFQDLVFIGEEHISHINNHINFEKMRKTWKTISNFVAFQKLCKYDKVFPIIQPIWDVLESLSDIDLPTDEWKYRRSLEIQPRLK